MKILWLGMNDENACVLHWHDLRCHLRDEHGVTLAGPGYSWDVGEKHSISEFGSDWDWIVLDDCNASGYVPLRWNVQPKCKVAWREHDWHNRFRQEAGHKIKPSVILSCYQRSLPVNDPFRDDPRRVFVPHAVSTNRFHPGNGQERHWKVGLYGTTASGYDERKTAKRGLRGAPDAWLPVHGGYWRDGRGSGPVTRYNDALAEDLRRVKCLWVSSGKWNGLVLKYFEGAASGCLLFGVKPEGWEECFPSDAMIECDPKDALKVSRRYSEDDDLRTEITKSAWEHLQAKHSIPARASQIMEVLHA